MSSYSLSITRSAELAQLHADYRQIAKAIRCPLRPKLSIAAMTRPEFAAEVPRPNLLDRILRRIGIGRARITFSDALDWCAMAADERERIMLHEIAHHLVPHTDGDQYDERFPHDEGFCLAFSAVQLRLAGDWWLSDHDQSTLSVFSPSASDFVAWIEERAPRLAGSNRGALWIGRRAKRAAWWLRMWPAGFVWAGLMGTAAACTFFLTAPTLLLY